MSDATRHVVSGPQLRTPQVRGWCPGALRPMASGDGLVLRIRPRNGALSVDQIRAIAHLSASRGNGLIDLTSRANLQLRGLDDAGHQAALDCLAGLDLLDPTPEAEARRNIILSPFAPQGGAAWQLARMLAQRLTQHLTAPDGPPLPGKFGFAIDDAAPVLTNAPADIRLIPAEVATGQGWHLHPDGADWHLVSTDPVADAMDLAHWFAAHRAGTGRMRDLVQTGLRHPAAHDTTAPIRAASRPQPGARPQGWLLGFAFGQIRAAQLAAIDAPVRLTPWRMLLVQSRTRPRVAGAIEAPDDPMLRIHACTGAPGCPQALADVRMIAHGLAPRIGAASLHVSGCAKGCAHTGPTAVTLVATAPDRFALIRDGGPSDTPTAHLDGAALRSLPFAAPPTSSKAPQP